MIKIQTDELKMIFLFRDMAFTDNTNTIFIFKNSL